VIGPRDRRFADPAAENTRLREELRRREVDRRVREAILPERAALPLRDAALAEEGA
jgi:hypothetical protein